MTGKPIKSVQRVFEILELFDRERRPIPAKEVSKRLGYPLMSAHELLKSMRDLGYADYNSLDRTYTPARALLSVIGWVNDRLDEEGDIRAFMKALSEETKETINLSRRIGTQVKIFYGLESRQAVSVSVQVGTAMPATGSLTGIASLSKLDEDALKQFLDDLKKTDAEQAQTADHDLIHSIFEELRDCGTTARMDVFVKGIGAVCLPVFAKSSDEVYVIGIVGPSDRIRSHIEEHRRTLAQLIKHYKISTVFDISARA